jgi:acetate kinase
MLVFTAGIGEHNAAIRERVCAGLAYLGVALDPTANGTSADLIASTTSRIPVAVERTNEEWVAAWHATRLLAAR